MRKQYKVQKTKKMMDAVSDNSIMDYGDMSFNQLIQRLGEVKKAEKTPSLEELHQTAGEPVACSWDRSAKVYANGYGVYRNGRRAVILWIPECGSYTYHFVQGSGDTVPSDCFVGREIFGEQSWMLAVIVNGEHKIEEDFFHKEQ